MYFFNSFLINHKQKQFYLKKNILGCKKLLMIVFKPILNTYFNKLTIDFYLIILNL
jgi:hypothetical protein